MPRNYIRKTPEHSPAVVAEAVNLVINEGKAVRQVSKDLKVPRTTLQRYVAATKTNNELQQDTNFDKGSTKNRVFTDDLEKQLESYLLEASRQLHGLTRADLQLLAYEYAQKNKCRYPRSWDTKEKAGLDWVDGFLSRHSRLSIRKPQPTSLSRATSFNRHNLNLFYDNLEAVYEKFKFEPHAIWNMDETAISTVHRPPKVIADKTSKQVGQITSAERGVMCTFVGAINAQQCFLPPLIIFPRVKFKEYMLAGAPVGSIGAAHDNGWITREIFVTWLHHFIKHTHATKENRVLLLLDNQDSHVSMEAIAVAKEHGVEMLTFPPHCTHRLQPLDIAVYSPFKKAFFSACNSWHLSNPGRTLTIYNLAELANTAFSVSFTPNNIKSAFAAPGIYPLNRYAFTDEDLACSSVTDRPDPSSTPSTSSAPSSSTSAEQLVTPEHIRPLPKAGERKNTGRKRRKTRTTAILTLTPQKPNITEAEPATTSAVAVKTKKKRKVSWKMESCISYTAGILFYHNV
jgi:hypothetical protein